ncbi:hypothetical protein EVAR_86541_1 [Eumeta japonica]|uniref:Uncharacterized protein n=1 Tax=Eumeta variegata TaxID=151549 RepID=A0A4C1VRE4_EUMVA|nr:hypothetical protein EVAR_86541_1 [Eumeta japonica]
MSLSKIVGRRAIETRPIKARPGHNPARRSSRRRPPASPRTPRRPAAAMGTANETSLTRVPVQRPSQKRPRRARTSGRAADADTCAPTLSTDGRKRGELRRFVYRERPTCDSDGRDNGGSTRPVREPRTQSRRPQHVAPGRRGPWRIRAFVRASAPARPSARRRQTGRRR